MRYDWLKSSVLARKHLYIVCKAVVDRHFFGDWRKFYSEIFGKDYALGNGYEDNFRAGKIGRKKSAVICDWLNVHYFDYAIALLAAVLSLTDDWASLFEELPQTNAIGVFASRTHFSVGFARKRSDIPNFRLQDEFIFYNGCNKDVSIVAFQCVQGIWLLMPLSENYLYCLAKKESKFPVGNDGNLLMLSEYEHKGTHEFVFIISDEATIMALDDLVEDKIYYTLPPYDLTKALLTKNREQIQVCRLSAKFW